MRRDPLAATPHTRTLTHAVHSHIALLSSLVAATAFDYYAKAKLDDL